MAPLLEVKEASVDTLKEEANKRVENPLRPFAEVIIADLGAIVFPRALS
jgi:hypothetical protein